MQELYEYLHAPNEMPLFKQRQRYGEDNMWATRIKRLSNWQISGFMYSFNEIVP